MLKYKGIKKMLLDDGAIADFWDCWIEFFETGCWTVPFTRSFNKLCGK